MSHCRLRPRFFAEKRNVSRESLDRAGLPEMSSYWPLSSYFPVFAH